MQKLHLWFARRRKNTTHSLRNKWLIYISSVGQQGHQTAHSGLSQSQTYRSKNGVVKHGTTATIQNQKSSPTLKPWAHLGAGPAKPAPKKGQLGRKVSEVRPSINEGTESSISEDRSQATSTGKPR